MLVEPGSPSETLVLGRGCTAHYPRQYWPLRRRSSGVPGSQDERRVAQRMESRQAKGRQNRDTG